MVPLYVWDNSTNSGKYAYNSVQACYATWYHKFNSSCHTDTESWYMWEKGVPNGQWLSHTIFGTPHRLVWFGTAC